VYGKRLRGVRAPHRKNTSGCAPARMPAPAAVVIPMMMHIGAPAKPVVAAGDTVKVGQLIAEASGFVSSPVYSGVSGKVKAIDSILLPGGQTSAAIVIESDGEQALRDGLAPPPVSDLKSFLAAVRESGVVGLGGAGFPTAAKLTVELPKIKAVIINGAECEPYITSDTRTMLDQSDLLWEGVLMLKKYLEADRVIIAIENNKPDCIALYEGLARAQDGVEIKTLPSLYPQGGEKVLIYNTTGLVVGEGKLPIDAGALVLNCTTLAAVVRYIKTGMPLVEKCVTVDGSAVANPQNVIVPVGTKLSDLFDFCGGFKSEPKKIMYGGPMMGLALTDLSFPILKTTNAVIALGAKDAIPPKETACIKCGRCIASCPLRLMPANIEQAFRRKNPEELEQLKVNICMECGCCSYICPAKRPLVHVNKLAKIMLRDYQDKNKTAAKKEGTLK